MSRSRPSRGRVARRLSRAALDFEQTGGKVGEAGLAALAVVARRNQLLQAALDDPASADHAELARMAPEKVAAAALAGIAALDGWVRVQKTLLQFWQREMQIGLQAGLRLMRSASPDAALRIQHGAVADAAQRWAGLTAALTQLAAVGTAGAFSPFHRRVTANARRLARSRASDIPMY